MVQANNTLIQFLLNEYPDEATAVDYLTKARWGNQITCPYCSGDKVNRVSGSQPHKCRPCNKKFSVKTKTFMHNSPIPVRAWLLMMFFMAKSRTGSSSLWLSKQLGITQKSTWYMGHRIRQACQHKFGQLLGPVEVDETYLGGKEANKHANKKTHSKTAHKQPVVGFKTRTGSVRAKAVDHINKTSLTRLVRQNVAIGEVVYTDSHSGYGALKKHGYQHETVNHSLGEYVRGEVHTNGIESFWALVKRSIKGTYTHVSPTYLQRYLDEITFRENADDFIGEVCQNV